MSSLEEDRLRTPAPLDRDAHAGQPPPTPGELFWGLMSDVPGRARWRPRAGKGSERARALGGGGRVDQGAGWGREGAWVWGQTTWRGPAGSSRLGAALTPPTGALTSRDALHLRAGQEQDGDCVLGPRHRGHCPQSPGACTGLPGSHSWAVCAPGWGPGQVPNSAPTRLQIQHPLSACPLGLQGTALFLGLILQSVGFFFPGHTSGNMRVGELSVSQLHPRGHTPWPTEPQFCSHCYPLPP